MKEDRFEKLEKPESAGKLGPHGRLDPSKKLDVREILRDLENYRPRRHGWTWRKKISDKKVGPFRY